MVKHTATKTKSNQKQHEFGDPLVTALNTKTWADKPAKAQTKKRGLTSIMNDIITEFTKEANGLADKIPKNELSSNEVTKLKNTNKDIHSTVAQIKQAKDNITQKVTTVKKEILKRFDTYDNHLVRLYDSIDETERTIIDLHQKAVNQWTNDGHQIAQDLSHKIHNMIHNHK